MSDRAEAIKAIGAAAAAVAGGAGQIAIAIPVAAPGILGAIGLTTTATIAIPVAGVVAVGGLIYYGAKEVFKQH